MAGNKDVKEQDPQPKAYHLCTRCERCGEEEELLSTSDQISCGRCGSLTIEYLKKVAVYGST